MLRSGMRSEERLLLSLLRAFVSRRLGHSVELESRFAPDWHRFVEIARDQKLTPVLYALMREQLWQDAPQFVADAMRKGAMDGAVSNAILEREALRVIRRLNQGGVTALVYKGLVLGETLYGDTSLRPHQDLDLMLRSSDVAAAVELLCAEGYEPEPELARATPKEWRHWCELNFDRKIAEGLSGRFHVELHWRVLPGFTGIVAGDAEDMVRRRRTLRLSGLEVFVPDPVDHFLALALHGAKHRWEELRLVLDVALLAATLSTDDVQVLRARAQEQRVRRLTSLALRLGERLGGPALASPDDEVDALADEAEHRIFSPSVRRRFTDATFLLRCLDSWTDVGRYLTARARAEVDRPNWRRNISHAFGRALELFRA